MGGGSAHYTEMVLEERRVSFGQAQANQEYNHRLLDEQEEQLAAGTTILPIVDVAGHEALVDSYHSARKILHDRRRYRLYQSELVSTYWEFD